MTDCVHDELVRPEGQHETNEYVCKECNKAIKTSVLPVRKTMIQRPQQQRRYSGTLAPPPPPRQQQGPVYIQPPPPMREQEREKSYVEEVSDFFAPINNQKPMTEEFFNTTFGDGQPKKRGRKKK